MAKRGRKEVKKRKVSKFVYWAPRITSIVFIAFLSLFSLDIFDMKLGFWGTILGLFMHNIPVFILIIALVIAWRWEWVGAVGFIFAGLVYIGFLVMKIIRGQGEWGMYLAWGIQIAGPAFFVGILFWKNWTAKRKK